MPASMARFNAAEDQAILDASLEEGGVLPVYIAVDPVDRLSSVHWRIVWPMKGPLSRGTPTEPPKREDGWHVLEILIPTTNNPAAYYTFRNHWRATTMGSAVNWIRFKVGELDAESRKMLALYCAEQDPTQISQVKQSNCVTCVMQAVRAISLTPEQIAVRPPAVDNANHLVVRHDYLLKQEVEQAIKDAVKYTLKVLEKFGGDTSGYVA